MAITDLSRGAFSGKETFLYYNVTQWATPTYVEIVRARNVSVNDGPELSDVQFHGADNTSQIPGYAAFNGSFEYVRRTKTDPVWDALTTARDNGDIIELMHLNGAKDDPDAVGWRAPCLLGEFVETSNGGDPVSVTIPFSLADAYDDSDNAIGKEPAVGTTAAATVAGQNNPPVSSGPVARQRV